MPTIQISVSISSLIRGNVFCVFIFYLVLSIFCYITLLFLYYYQLVERCHCAHVHAQTRHACILVCFLRSVTRSHHVLVAATFNSSCRGETHAG